ncbi:MAG: 8-oxoguanine deaminase [Chloroflexi bacterium]|nr:8-oxoguanine deaminase [Chloroflexota bacterium]
MGTLLIRHARLLVTMDAERREIADGAVYVRDHVIEQVGRSADLPDSADRVIDASDRVVLPGLVNTHHHLFQSLTRAVPGAQQAKLFRWLRTLYRIWPGIDAEAIRVSAKLALAELLLSGCTTACDHLYLFPNGARLDDEIEAARELGIRFHPCRGSMSLGESNGGLPPDSIVEQDEEAILTDCRRVLETYHEPQRYGLCRIAIAPCAPFNVSEALMRASVELARGYGVRLHTHVAETLDEEEYCLKRVGLRPIRYMEALGWLGADVWWAHVVWPSADEISLLAETQTGVAHCPSSNMRLGSGIAPVREYLQAGVPVGLAVDGSASNDSGHMLAEARQALMLQRVTKGADALSARQALELATLGGARILGRDDIGALAPGMAADLVAFDLRSIDLAGAQADPLAALLLCTPQRADLALVHGRVLVEDGHLVGVDLAQLAAAHNAISARLLQGVTPRKARRSRGA